MSENWELGLAFQGLQQENQTLPHNWSQHFFFFWNLLVTFSDPITLAVCIPAKPAACRKRCRFYPCPHLPSCGGFSMRWWLNLGRYLLPWYLFFPTQNSSMVFSVKVFLFPKVRLSLSNICRIIMSTLQSGRQYFYASSSYCRVCSILSFCLVGASKVPWLHHSSGHYPTVSEMRP